MLQTALSRKAGKGAAMILCAVASFFGGLAAGADEVSPYQELQLAQKNIIAAEAFAANTQKETHLLEVSLSHLQNIPAGTAYESHRAGAAEDVQEAIDALGKDDPDNRVSGLTLKAITEVEAALAMAHQDAGADRDSTNSGNLSAAQANEPSDATVKPADSVEFTAEQAHAMVTVSGDNASGAGFLIRTPEGPAVVTNIHVIANNPNLKITTDSGAEVTVLSAKGAWDRDVALLSVQDAGYHYLDVSIEISRTVQVGDEVITPGNSSGGGVQLDSKGKILGVGPERIEFNNPFYHGNSGGPVYHPKSGKVLGVVTEALKVFSLDDLTKSSFASRNSSLGGPMRYYGLRVDTVSAWVPIDWERLKDETVLLDEFHELSCCLDSYLNRGPHGRYEVDSGAVANFYRRSEKIMKANASYYERTADGDESQHLDALRGLIVDLDSIADDKVDLLQDGGGLYPFNQIRAKDEMAYRSALKSELDSLSDNVERMKSLPRGN